MRLRASDVSDSPDAVRQSGAVTVRAETAHESWPQPEAPPLGKTDGARMVFSWRGKRALLVLHLAVAVTSRDIELVCRRAATRRGCRCYYIRSAQRWSLSGSAGAVQVMSGPGDEGWVEIPTWCYSTTE